MCIFLTTFTIWRGSVQCNESWNQWVYRMELWNVAAACQCNHSSVSPNPTYTAAMDGLTGVPNVAVSKNVAATHCGVTPNGPTTPMRIGNKA